MKIMIQFFVFLSLIFNVLHASAQDFKTGDIIFQTSQSAQSVAVQNATKSPYSHMGMVVFRKGQPWVLEAIQPIKYTSLDAWIKRGVNQHYVVKRYEKPLTIQQQLRLVSSAEKYLGKDYDLYFAWDDDAIYCSELVWKAYNEALGVQLAPLQQLKQFNLTDVRVRALMKKRYGDEIPLSETVISPYAIFQSKFLQSVSSN